MGKWGAASPSSLRGAVSAGPGRTGADHVSRSRPRRCVSTGDKAAVAALAARRRRDGDRTLFQPLGGRQNDLAHSPPLSGRRGGALHLHRPRGQCARARLDPRHYAPSRQARTDWHDQPRKPARGTSDPRIRAHPRSMGQRPGDRGRRRGDRRGVHVDRRARNPGDRSYREPGFPPRPRKVRVCAYGVGTGRRPGARRHGPLRSVPAGAFGLGGPPRRAGARAPPHAEGHRAPL